MKRWIQSPMDGKDIKIFSFREYSVPPLSTAEFRNGKHHHQHFRLPGRGIGITQRLWICSSTTLYSTLSPMGYGKEGSSVSDTPPPPPLPPFFLLILHTFATFSFWSSVRHSKWIHFPVFLFCILPFAGSMRIRERSELPHWLMIVIKGWGSGTSICSFNMKYLEAICFSSWWRAFLRCPCTLLLNKLEGYIVGSIEVLIAYSVELLGGYSLFSPWGALLGTWELFFSCLEILLGWMWDWIFFEEMVLGLFVHHSSDPWIRGCLNKGSTFTSDKKFFFLCCSLLVDSLWLER